MKEKFNKIKRAISESVRAPIGVYLVILIIAIILLIAGYCFCDSNSPEGEIAKNVGFSLLATFIASLFTDMSTTSKQHKNDKLIVDRLLLDLKVESEDILSELMLATQECFGIDEEKRTYSEWTEMLFGGKELSEKNTSEIRYYIQKISDVKLAAQKASEICKLYYNNSFVDEPLEKRLKKIVSLCQSVEARCNSKHYRRCISMLNLLKKTIVEQFPELAEQFNSKYNHDNLSMWE